MDKVERYYDQNVDREWKRLEQHRTEFAVTMRALAEYLPPAPCTVLDNGGGPGRYAIALARQGYSVTLSDVSQQNLARAQQQAALEGVTLSDFVHANALDLSTFPSARFDAVLLMGPLYHLLVEADRRRAIREVRRVLKPQGVIVVTFIGRYAPVRDVAAYEPLWALQHQERLEQMLATGVSQATTEGAGFTDAYFAHPAEIRPLMESEGFATLDLIAAEGVISEIESEVNKLEGEAWDYWVELNYRLGKDPSVHGCAEHLVYVGRNQTE